MSANSRLTTDRVIANGGGFSTECESHGGCKHQRNPQILHTQFFFLNKYFKRKKILKSIQKFLTDFHFLNWNKDQKLSLFLEFIENNLKAKKDVTLAEDQNIEMKNTIRIHPNLLIF